MPTPRLPGRLTVVEAEPTLMKCKREAEVAIFTVLALVAPVAILTVVAPVPVPRLRVRVSEEEATVMAPVWLVSPMRVMEEEALFTVKAPSDVRELESRVRVA